MAPKTGEKAFRSPKTAEAELTSLAERLYPKMTKQIAEERAGAKSKRVRKAQAGATPKPVGNPYGSERSGRPVDVAPADKTRMHLDRSRS